MGDIIHLHELSIAPEHGCKGLGTRLIETITQFAKNSGFTGVTLSTFREIPWNAPFYKKLGFRAMKESEIDINLQNIRTKEARNGLLISERILKRSQFTKILQFLIPQDKYNKVIQTKFSTIMEL